MDKGIKATLCVTCAFAVMFGIVTGCSVIRSNSTAASSGTTAASADATGTDTSADGPAAGGDLSDPDTEPSQVTYKLPIQHYPNASYISVKDDYGIFPSAGTVGGYEYTVAKPHGLDIPDQKTRGFYIDTLEEPDSPYYFIICSGKKSTGGHDIRIVDLGMNGNTLYIVAEETSPAPDEMVTEAFEYPYCVLELDKLPDSYEVINTGGFFFPRILEFSMDEETQNILYDLNDGNDYQVPDGYCAVLHGGSGEITYKTYVYCHDDSAGDQTYYEYIHVTSTTVSWGSPISRNTLDTAGTKDTKEAIVETARDHNSCQFMTLPGDYRNVYSINDFLTMEFVPSDAGL